MHPLNRPHQLETYQNIQNSTEKWIVVEAPTGSGKSAWAAQSAHDGNRSLVLVKTKSLQDQYRSSYDFEVVKGKSNYPCNCNFMPDASMCKIPRQDANLKEQCSNNCPYPAACQDFLGSNFGCLNYSKYRFELFFEGLVTRYEPETIWLDEAHQLSDIVIETAGISIAWTEFLKAYIAPRSIPSTLPRGVAVKMAVDWLTQLLKNLLDNEPPKVRRGASPEVIRYRKRWENLVRQVGSVIDMIDYGTDYWYAESDSERGFRLKPLTARFHFPQLFNRAKKIVLMSATIGDARPFMAELGILEDWQSIIVPDVYPASDRPIHALDVPAYKATMTEQERQAHAQGIAGVLNSANPAWNALVHAQGGAGGTRMIYDLASRLGRMTDRPIWTPSEQPMGTEQALADWLLFERRNRGAVAITHQFYEGVDMPHLNISITARIPFPDFGDQYEKERFDFDHRSAITRIANTVRQQQGRNRRGYKEHYGPEADKLNVIADSKWQRVKWAFGDSFTEAII